MTFVASHAIFRDESYVETPTLSTNIALLKSFLNLNVATEYLMCSYFALNFRR